MNEIKKEIEKCLECNNPICQLGCPLKNDIKGFIKCLKKDKIEEAFYLLSKTAPIPSLCGLICPHEKQCQGMCNKIIPSNPVEIGKIEAFIGKYALLNNLKIKSPKITNHHVLIIGGGPAGLSCAYILRQAAIKVTIFEKHDYLGGLLVHGIPEFRLDKNLVKKAINNILDLGIDVCYQKELGKDFQLDDIKNQYDSIFLSIGSNISNHLNIKGEDLKGVYGALEFLENKEKIPLDDKEVIVIGGGDTAIDVARTLIRKNAKKVTIVYRNTKEKMKCQDKEFENAKLDGVNFLFQTNILSIKGHDKISKIELIKTKEEEFKIQNIEGSNYEIKCDLLIKAIGSHPDPLIKKLGLNLDQKGQIDVDGKFHTSISKIYAGGDIAGCKNVVAWACRSGIIAAEEIIEKLKES